MVRTGTKIESIREIMKNMPKADLSSIDSIENAIKKARIKTQRTTLYKVRSEILGITSTRKKIKTAKRGTKKIVENNSELSNNDIIKYTLQIKHLADRLTVKKLKSMIDIIVKIG